MINLIPQGWQCPLCNTIHAPTVLRCECNQGDKIVSLPSPWTIFPGGTSPNTLPPPPWKVTCEEPNITTISVTTSTQAPTGYVYVSKPCDLQPMFNGSRW